MVRSAALRKAKYEAKIDADVQRSRILAQKDSMVTQMEAASANLAQVETDVKKAIEGQTTPIYGYQIPAYLNVGRKLASLQRKFSGTTFTAEATAALDQFEAKGLLGWALTLIAELFGVTY